MLSELRARGYGEEALKVVRSPAGLPIGASGQEDAAGKDREALMLLLGDQPGVRTEFIDFALSKWRQERLWASVTSYQGGLGNPFIVAREAFGDLRGLHGDKAVWKLIEAYPDLVLRVEIDAALPPDVDTPEDYETALTRWRSGA